MAALYREANRTDLNAAERPAVWYRVAEFLVGNPERIYFNDALLWGLQRYAFDATPG